MPQEAGFQFIRYGADATGPGLVDSQAFPDLNAVLAGQLDFDGDLDLVETGPRTVTFHKNVTIEGHTHQVDLSGFDADGRQIYRITGFLQDFLTAREQGADVLRRLNGGADLIVRFPNIDEDDFSGGQSIFEIEDQDDLDQEAVAIVGDWYVTHLVLVGVRVL